MYMNDNYKRDYHVSLQIVLQVFCPNTVLPRTQRFTLAMGGAEATLVRQRAPRKSRMARTVVSLRTPMARLSFHQKPLNCWLPFNKKAACLKRQGGPVHREVAILKATPSEPLQVAQVEGMPAMDTMSHLSSLDALSTAGAQQMPSHK